MSVKEEFENAADVLNELTEHHKNFKEIEFKFVGVNTNTNIHHEQCPRCKQDLRISSGHTYCIDCNWDSLDELRLHVDKWIA